jgi:hypothetical protein
MQAATVAKTGGRAVSAADAGNGSIYKSDQVTPILHRGILSQFFFPCFFTKFSFKDKI